MEQVATVSNCVKCSKPVTTIHNSTSVEAPEPIMCIECSMKALENQVQ